MPLGNTRSRAGRTGSRKAAQEPQEVMYPYGPGIPLLGSARAGRIRTDGPGNDL